MQIEFNDMLTEYTCPSCGEPVPVDIEVYGLDVQLNENGTRELLVQHARAAPNLHRTWTETDESRHNL